MRFVILILLLLCLHPATYGQKGTEFELVQTLYKGWERNRFMPYGITCDTFFYIDKVDSDLIETVQEKIRSQHIFDKGIGDKEPLDEKIIFSRRERRLIIKQLGLLKKNRWSDNLFPHSKMVKSEFVPFLVNLTNRSDDLLEKKLCKSYRLFSEPIFIRDNLCIFFMGDADVLSTEGDCCLYKKIDGKWMRYSLLANWLSWK